jgi:tetratricopeptide (TPR) repeat protein
MVRRHALLAATVLLISGVSLAQDIDGTATDSSRTQTDIAGQISDRAERQAFLSLFKKSTPSASLRSAKTFLADFPQSAFLAQAYEVAARASIDQQDYVGGLDYAKKSLALLPENVLLLVSVADIEARQDGEDAAIQYARDALQALDSFSAPGSISKEDWPQLKQQWAATANFAIARTLLGKALKVSPGAERDALLKECQSSLTRARELSPSDPEITLLSGLTAIAAGQLQISAAKFAKVYRGGGELAPLALQNLQTIYAMLNLKSQLSFEAFVNRIQE